MNVYWLGALVATWIACLGAGWESRTWYDKSAQEAVESHTAKDLGKGAAKIIGDDQKLDKELDNAKDPCLLDHLPISYD